MKNNKGFTLVEMLVVMGVFVIVLMITGRSFDTIISQSSKLFRSEDSNIEGMVGLEMLRHDIQQGGLGLFTEAPPLTYSEAAATPASNYNDTTNYVPRPFVAGNNLAATPAVGSSPLSTTVAGTDYLAIKATTVARNQAAQKWSHLFNTGGVPAPAPWPSAAENYNAGEYFILLRKSFTTPQRTTVERNASDNSLWFRLNTPAFDAYTSQGTSVFITYGIDDSSFRFPFNRADYFVARANAGASVPPMCAPNTGVLYKGTINQSNGNMTYIPLVDCVADMQIILGWDINFDGVLDTWSNADGSAVSGTGSSSDVQNALTQGNNAINSQSTVNIRNCLKMVKVYLIVQDGKKDMNYTSPATVQIGDTGEGTLLRNGSSSPAVYTLSADMRNYRWKEYRIVARPKNLLSNQ